MSPLSVTLLVGLLVVHIPDTVNRLPTKPNTQSTKRRRGGAIKSVSRKTFRQSHDEPSAFKTYMRQWSEQTSTIRQGQSRLVIVVIGGNSSPSLSKTIRSVRRPGNRIRMCRLNGQYHIYSFVARHSIGLVDDRDLIARRRDEVCASSIGVQLAISKATYLWPSSSRRSDMTHAYREILRTRNTKNLKICMSLKPDRHRND